MVAYIKSTSQNNFDLLKSTYLCVFFDRRTSVFDTYSDWFVDYHFFTYGLNM